MQNIHELLQGIAQEESINAKLLHLTANEAQMSQTARKAFRSPLAERYYMGGGMDGILDLEPFTARGMKGVENLVKEAQQAAKEMLHAESVNLNCLSGVHAMMCAILSTTNSGDTVMTVKVADGGHFATRGILDVTGRKSISAVFNQSTLEFDLEATAREFKSNNAKALYLDVSYYINAHNLRGLRDALGKEAIIIYDASHTMGLILGQEFQSPLTEGADVICANTHKTLPGPHKGMIAFRNKELGEKANSIINGCLFSTQHANHLMALSITLLEMKEFGQEYAKQIIKNSNTLGEEFTKLGYEVRKANNGKYSNNHQVHVFIDHFKESRSDLYKRLLDNNISTNFDAPLGGRLFIRLGTQEITRRGMKEQDMIAIAQFIDNALQSKDVSLEVFTFNEQFQNIEYSFDNLVK